MEKNNFLIKVKKDKITNSYKFIKQLGRGASGVCFKAVLKTDNSLIRCIKKIAKSKKGEQNIPNEAILLDQLSHPDIIRLYDVFEDENSFYLVMDCCEGGELFDYLDDEGALSQHEAKQIFLQMISAVGYCHEKKIVHRDLKPENFLIFQKVQKGKIPNIKLIDFDLSFQWHNNPLEEIIESEGKRIIGTPYYIAPEVLKGRYDHRCDIWSAGVILHILVTGVPPFNGESTQEILKSVEKHELNLQSKKIDNIVPQMKNISQLFQDLLRKILVERDKRLTIEEILRHPWMSINSKKTRFNIDYSSMIKYSKYSKLKQIAARYLAMQMTAKQLLKLDEIFKQLDVNKDGYLSVEELKNGLNYDSIVGAEIDHLLHFVQVDSNGLMNYEDFLSSFVSERNLESKQYLRVVFNIIDNDKNGLVDKQQLNNILNRFGMKKKCLKEINVNQQINQIFLSADKNNDGNIDFQEFVSNVCQHVDY